MAGPKPPALPMLPWWPSDYFSATRSFTLAERGAYTDLLFYSWLNGPLPHEPERLARLVGVTPQEFADVWPTVRSKFEATAQGLINHRLERERRRSFDLRSKNSEKAAGAARARWLKEQQETNARSNAPSIQPSDSLDAPSNARSNAPSIDAAQQGLQKPDLMLGAMLERCPPSPSPSPSQSQSPAPAVGGGKEGSGENRGNLPALSPEQIWKGQQEKIAKAIAAQPDWNDQQIATILLPQSGITKEMVKRCRKPVRARAENNGANQQP
jgi:uncharacterized protein YdaU (DUF1376 family)